MDNLKKKVKQSLTGYDKKESDKNSFDESNLPIDKDFTWNLDLPIDNKT